MSMPRGCTAIELKPNEWYVVIAYREHDYDFTEGHRVYGPKTTADAVLDECFANESNPGAFDTVSHAEVGLGEAHLVSTGAKIKRGSGRRW